MSTTNQKPLFIDVTAIMLACDKFADKNAKVGEIFNIDPDDVAKLADVLTDKDNQYNSYAEMVKGALGCIIAHPPLIAHNIIQIADVLSGKFLDKLIARLQ